MTQDERDSLLKGFLNEFKDLSKLTLDKYTGTGEDRIDFTYWVEWKLDCFGGIRGGSSYKFGVYKCNEKPRERKGYNYDEKEQYAWVEKYGETYTNAFNKVKENIQKVYECVQKEQIEYNEIERIDLGDAYKWKIAFLYSNYRLVPVYQKDALVTAAKRIGVFPENEKEITIAKLQEVLMKYYDDHKDEFSEGVCGFGVHVWRIGTSDLSQSNQLVKYGAPGTGKTYTAKKEAEEFFGIWKLDARNNSADFAEHYEFVQFHPSYTYEDFIEGIKPIIDNGKTELRLTNGIFKSFCEKAAKYEIWLLKNGVLNDDKILEDVTVGDVFDLQDCPFEFPSGVNHDDPISQYIPPYFFVIDEINRADLSRVFGELMYCLEYRGYKGRIKTQYSELENSDTEFYKEKGQCFFFIPNNVYIIGTMNTIDRSIESFDFALRRRFLWQRIDPDSKVLQKYFVINGKPDFADLVPSWEALNREIANNSLLGKDYQIGHSYLMKLDKYPNCTKTQYRDKIWTKHIQPILEEYFRGTGEAEKQIEKLGNVFCKK